MSNGSESSKVIQFKAPPKSVRVDYKGRSITITYQPATQVWHWEFEQVARTPFDGDAESEKAALKAAKKRIDYIDGDPS